MVSIYISLVIKIFMQKRFVLLFGFLIVLVFIISGCEKSGAEDLTGQVFYKKIFGLDKGKMTDSSTLDRLKKEAEEKAEFEKIKCVEKSTVGKECSTMVVGESYVLSGDLHYDPVVGAWVKDVYNGDEFCKNIGYVGCLNLCYTHPYAVGIYNAPMQGSCSGFVVSGSKFEEESRGGPYFYTTITCCGIKPVVIKPEMAQSAIFKSVKIKKIA